VGSWIRRNFMEKVATLRTKTGTKGTSCPQNSVFSENITLWKHFEENNDIEFAHIFTLSVELKEIINFCLKMLKFSKVATLGRPGVATFESLLEKLLKTYRNYSEKLWQK